MPFETPPTPKQEQQTSPFEAWLSSEFREQYDTRAKALDRANLLQILPESGGYGIVDSKGRECLFPEREDIQARLLANKEFFEKKFSQGFTDLSITPFGLPLQTLFKRTEQVILRHHQAGHLFSREKDGTRVRLNLDTEHPLFRWEGYQDQEIAYFPEHFDTKDHGGKTKEAVIESSSFPGFLVSFIEKGPIPRAGRGETKNGRKRIEANKTPIECLALLRNDPMYQEESGTVIEEWLTLLITHLEETGEVIDDYEGNGSVNYNLGTFFPADGIVSNAYWNRDSRRASVDGNGARSRSESYGSRVSVRV